MVADPPTRLQTKGVGAGLFGSLLINEDIGKPAPTSGNTLTTVTSERKGVLHPEMMHHD